MNIIKLLENKWGKFEKKDNYYTNGKMPFISEKSRLNALFNPLTSEEIKMIETKFNINLPNDLKQFYLFSNGCRLFFSGLNIYGLQIHGNDLFEPFDIFIENNELSEINKKNELVFIGSIGGDYALAIKNESNTITVVSKETGEQKNEFCDFRSMFDYYFQKLYYEYDEKCKKIHINKEFEDFPALAHAVIDLP